LAPAIISSQTANKSAQPQKELGPSNNLGPTANKFGQPQRIRPQQPQLGPLMKKISPNNKYGLPVMTWLIFILF
jgi:hypothetical protein